MADSSLLECHIFGVFELETSTRIQLPWLGPCEDPVQQLLTCDLNSFPHDSVRKGYQSCQIPPSEMRRNFTISLTSVCLYCTLDDIVDRDSKITT